MGRNYHLKVKCTSEEIDKIKGKAKMMGMNVSAFVRYICLASKINVSVNEDD